MTNPLFDALFAPHLEAESDFLILPDGATWTHGAFLRLAAQYAHHFDALGLGPGDRVAVQLAKSPQALAIYAACVQTGLVFLPLNPAYTAAEVAYFLDNASAGLLICDPAGVADLRGVAQETGAAMETLDAAGRGSLTEAATDLPTQHDIVPRGPEDLAALLYTSGTTGRSKGAMLSQRNLLSNAQTLCDAWQFTADDVLLHGLPIFHTHGLFVASNVMLLCGGSMVFFAGLDVPGLIDWMPRATSMMGVPTFYTRLLDAPAFTRDVAAGMRLFISGSAPLLAETHSAFEARTGHRILERYGMTETNMNTSNPYDGPRLAGTVGPPLPGVEVKICNPESGETLPQGEVGVIEVRGDNVFQGYWQMPEKTAAELRADGFFITGDLGRIDENGYVSIVGRGKDLIISGGYNIYPKEVELALDAQPGVLESAVVGAPHADLGEAPVAVLVPQAGATLDTGDIAQAVGRDLARFKCPRHYVVLDALPRNTMGKVQKNLLRDQVATVFRD